VSLKSATGISPEGELGTLDDWLVEGVPVEDGEDPLAGDDAGVEGAAAGVVVPPPMTGVAPVDAENFDLGLLKLFKIEENTESCSSSSFDSCSEVDIAGATLTAGLDAGL
jgi:hypothetical protein